MKTAPLLIAAVLLLASCSSPANRGPRSTLELELRELVAAENLLTDKPQPSSCDASVFVSTGTLQKLAKTLEGIESPISSVTGARLQLVNFSLVPDVGNTRVRATVVAKLEDELHLEAKFNAFLAFDKIEVAGIPARSAALFKIVPEISSLKFDPIGIKSPAFVNRIITERLVEKFADSLVFPVPLETSVRVDLGFKKTFVVPIKSTNGAITFDVGLPSQPFLVSIAFAPPLPTRDGLWFCGMVGDRRPGEKVPARSEAGSTEDQIEAVRRRVANQLSKVDVPKAAIQVSLKRSVFEAIIVRANGLSGADRRITFRSTAVSGRIVDKMNDAKIVGEGGYFVELAKATDAGATVDIGTISSGWIAGDGLSFKAPIYARATAALNVHVDPYIGGGFNISMGVEGRAEHTVRGTLVARMIKVGDESAFVYAPITTCEQFATTIEAGGAVKFGARIYSTVGSDVTEPTVLASSVPFYSSLSKGTNGGSPGGQIWLETKLTPLAAGIAEDGFVFEADANFAKRTEKPDPDQIRALEEKITSGVQSAWLKTFQVNCPARKDPVFLFAGEDFGKNNTLVQLLGEIGKALKNAKRNMDIAVDDINEIKDHPERMPKKIGEIAQRGLAEVNRTVDKAVRPVRRILRRLKKW